MKHSVELFADAVNGVFLDALRRVQEENRKELKKELWDMKQEIKLAIGKNTDEVKAVMRECFARQEENIRRHLNCRE